ncbi:MAG: mechanosensitive ion channel domain-containing protein [Patescibacteria group bacterium]
MPYSVSVKAVFSRIGAASVLALIFVFQPILAQGAAQPISETTLTALYKAQLARTEPDPYVEKRILDERARIRSQIDDELNAFLSERIKEEEAAIGDLTTAVERQKTVLASLEERLRDREVDLDLLIEEEKKFYLASKIPDATEGEYRLTKTHSELLAKKAILEESVAATKFFLTPQRERLQKLTFDLRLQQFAGLINVGKYVLLLLLIFFLERFIRTKFLVRIKNRSRRYAAMKIFTAAVYIVIIFWMLGRLFAEHPGILTSFAIVGAGLAVALSDVVKDFIGWAVIVQGRRFSLGQRISVGSVTGDVIDIGILRTTLLEVATAGSVDLERTGRTVFIPNWHVLNFALANYNTTSDYLKAEMTVTVTYESEWRRARKILQEILTQLTGEYLEKARMQALMRTQQFYYSHEMREPVVYTDLGADGVQFTLRFFVPVGERRAVMSAISEKILERFHAETPPISLAYKTSRVYATSVPWDLGLGT